MVKCVSTCLLYTSPAVATKPKETHVAGYDEFCKLAKENNVPPAEITKYIATEFKKPRLAFLDEFEIVAALDWLKKFIEKGAE